MTEPGTLSRNRGEDVAGPFGTVTNRPAGGRSPRGSSGTPGTRPGTAGEHPGVKRPPKPRQEEPDTAALTRKAGWNGRLRRSRNTSLPTSGADSGSRSERSGERSGETARGPRPGAGPARHQEPALHHRAGGRQPGGEGQGTVVLSEDSAAHAFRMFRDDVFFTEAERRGRRSGPTRRRPGGRAPGPRRPRSGSASSTTAPPTAARGGNCRTSRKRPASHGRRAPATPRAR